MRFEAVFFFAKEGEVAGRGDHDSVVEIVFEVRHEEIYTRKFRCAPEGFAEVLVRGNAAGGKNLFRVVFLRRAFWFRDEYVDNRLFE